MRMVFLYAFILQTLCVGHKVTESCFRRLLHVHVDAHDTTSLKWPLSHCTTACSYLSFW